MSAIMNFLGFRPSAPTYATGEIGVTDSGFVGLIVPEENEAIDNTEENEAIDNTEQFAASYFAKPQKSEGKSFFATVLSGLEKGLSGIFRAAVEFFRHLAESKGTPLTEDSPLN